MWQLVKKVASCALHYCMIQCCTKRNGINMTFTLLFCAKTFCTTLIYNLFSAEVEWYPEMAFWIINASIQLFLLPGTPKVWWEIIKKHPFLKKNIDDTDVWKTHPFAFWLFFLHGCIASHVVSTQHPPPPPPVSHWHLRSYKISDWKQTWALAM